MKQQIIIVVYFYNSFKNIGENTSQKQNTVVNGGVKRLLSSSSTNISICL